MIQVSPYSLEVIRASLFVGEIALVLVQGSEVRGEGIEHLISALGVKVAHHHNMFSGKRIKNIAHRFYGQGASLLGGGVVVSPAGKMHHAYM